MKTVLLSFIAFSFSIVNLQAQKITEDDYKRAVGFMYDNYNNKTAFNLYTQVNWFEDHSGFWFIDHSKQGKSYKTVAFKSAKAKLLFDHQKLAKALTELTNETVDANQLSLNKIEKVSEIMSFSSEGKDYELNLKTYELKVKTP